MKAVEAFWSHQNNNTARNALELLLGEASRNLQISFLGPNFQDVLSMADQSQNLKNYHL